MKSISLSGDLPSGDGPFLASVSGDVIAVRIGDRICVAHKRWMTPDEARAVADALSSVAADR